MPKKTHIQKLFDAINGGDCVDSAVEAQEIAEGLLEEAKRFIKAAKWLAEKHGIELDVISTEDAIAKANGR